MFSSSFFLHSDIVKENDVQKNETSQVIDLFEGVERRRGLFEQTQERNEIIKKAWPEIPVISMNELEECE